MLRRTIDDELRIPRREAAARIGISHAHLNALCQGRGLPTVLTASRVADGLMAPRLAEAVLAAWTGTCVACGATYVMTERGARRSRRRYCTPLCARRSRNVAAWAEDRVRLRDLLASSERDRAALEAESITFRETLRRWCLSCEWDGVCKTPECDLRPISPLPLVKDARRAA